MKKLKIALYRFFLFSFLCLGCQKSKDPIDSYPFSSTPEFEYEINGELYNPCLPYYGSTWPLVYGNVSSIHYSDGSAELQWAFEYMGDSSECFSFITIRFPYGKKGVIPLAYGDSTKGQLIFTDGNNSEIGNAKVYKLIPDDSFNRLEFFRNSDADLNEPNKKWWTGEFEFIGYKVNNPLDSVVITNGTFNHYYY